MVKVFLLCSFLGHEAWWLEWDPCLRFWLWSQIQMWLRGVIQGALMAWLTSLFKTSRSLQTKNSFENKSMTYSTHSNKTIDIIVNITHVHQGIRMNAIIQNDIMYTVYIIRLWNFNGIQSNKHFRYMKESATDIAIKDFDKQEIQVGSNDMSESE